jgi:hypothetical protein
LSARGGGAGGVAFKPGAFASLWSAAAAEVQAERDSELVRAGWWGGGVAIRIITAPPPLHLPTRAGSAGGARLGGVGGAGERAHCERTAAVAGAGGGGGAHCVHAGRG